MRHQKRCWLIKTAGRWTWKLSSAKECVITHLPNQPALKMDGAVAWNLYWIGRASESEYALSCRRVLWLHRSHWREPGWSGYRYRSW